MNNVHNDSQTRTLMVTKTETFFCIENKNLDFAETIRARSIYQRGYATRYVTDLKRKLDYR